MSLVELSTSSSWCVIVLSLAVFVLSSISGVATAGLRDPEEYRQLVADMKADIRAGRVTTIPTSSSADSEYRFLRFIKSCQS